MVLRHRNGSGANYIRMKFPLRLEEFEKSVSPQGSREFQLFERFTSKFELAGLLIEYGFLAEDLYYDRYGGLASRMGAGLNRLSMG